MAFKWKDSLTTGNTVIDNQHKELVDAANELLKAKKEEYQGKPEYMVTKDNF